MLKVELNGLILASATKEPAGRFWQMEKPVEPEAMKPAAG